MSAPGAKPPRMRSIPGNMPSSGSNPPPSYFDNQPTPSKSLMAGSTVWKTIFIPPLVALAIYLSVVYVLLPLYRRRARYSQYIPVSIPISSSSYAPQGFISRVRQRVLDALSPFGSVNRWRRGSHASADSMFGDEELEEGYGVGEIVPADRRNSDAGTGDERRLSRELEVGFRDESDEDDLKDSGEELRGANTQHFGR
ncbi:hypothetical protein MMC30_007744 [Trapelia coarctata]|nr:hypothetical protein [Trapelia coarctata]